MSNDAVITTYLQDHHAGSMGGTEAFKRVAQSHGDAHVRERVADIARRVEDDQTALEQIMDAVGSSTSTLKEAGTWVGEKVARLKPNERIAHRSPLSDLEELETLILGVHGKSMLWRALLQLDDPRLNRAQLEDLRDRADAQEAELRELWSTQVPKLLQG